MEQIKAGKMMKGKIFLSLALPILENAGLEENTIIVFTSDHGDMNGSHGLILKNVLFEECQRVPFIFAGKGISRNQKSGKNKVLGLL